MELSSEKGGLRTSWKKSCAAAVAVAGICAGTVAGAPAGAQAQETVYRTFQNFDNKEFLYGQDGEVRTRPGHQGITEWVLNVPPGAPQGVYQIQRSGTSTCLRAKSDSEAVLVRCVNNPGKPQRWKLDITPGAGTAIESRQYPGFVLAQAGGFVVLASQQSNDDEQA